MNQTPYSNPQAEHAVIGSCIVSKDALEEAAEIVKPSDFYDINNKLAYEVILDMYYTDMPVDFLTFSEALKAKGIFNRIGGQPYFAEVMADVSSPANVGYYAGIVQECSIRRLLIEAGNKIISSANRADKKLQEIIEEAEKLIFEASQNKTTSEFRHVKDIIAPVFSNIEESYKSAGRKSTGYSTNFDDLNAYIGGFQPGSLNIIAARPSMGKTAFAVNIAQFGGNGNNESVLIFSLEMPAEQIVMRMLAAESKVNLSQLNLGTFDTTAFAKVKEACSVLAKRNIYINDDSGLTALEFRSRCRRFKTKHPDLALIIVDYLQLMTSGGVRSDGRQQEVADISRMIKAVARELDCPIIALSQLSRATEQRTEKKPQLSDLRDSGAIEQDADTVMLMFREDYYSEEENNDLQNSKADIRVAKNRNGSTGVFHLTFEREITRFWGFEEQMLN